MNVFLPNFPFEAKRKNFNCANVTDALNERNNFVKVDLTKKYCKTVTGVNKYRNLLFHGS